MKVQTSILEGPALNFAVAKSEGYPIHLDHQADQNKILAGWWQVGPFAWQPLNEYSTDWSKAGPIIERNWMEITTTLVSQFGENWADLPDGDSPLPLLLRAHVANNLGHEVEIPDALLAPARKPSL